MGVGVLGEGSARPLVQWENGLDPEASRALGLIHLLLIWGLGVSHGITSITE